MTPELNQLFEERYYCVQFGFPTDEIEDRIQTHPVIVFVNKLFKNWWNTAIDLYVRTINKIRKDLCWITDGIRSLNIDIAGIIYIFTGYPHEYIKICHEPCDYYGIHSVRFGWIDWGHITQYYKKDTVAFIQRFIKIGRAHV